MTTIVHCDRCGERIEAGRTLDLRASCAQTLAEWINPEVNKTEQISKGATA